MAPWNPSMPWPGTAGGASSPHWGGYVRVFVRAGIASGNTWHLGPHAFDALDAGNVLGGHAVAGRAAGPARLWVDLTCDVLDVDIHHGAGSSAGIFTKADAATCQITLADPAGIYDPATTKPPYAYEGRTRLVPGIPVEVFAEVVDRDTGAVTTRYLFTGTADSWREDWTTKPSTRRCVLVASDATKIWSRYDRPEQPPVGTNDTTAQRIARLVAYFGWPGTVTGPASSSALFDATTLATSGIELLSRTMDDELGVAYFTADGRLRWTNRTAWFLQPAPVVTLACGDKIPAPIHDSFDVPDSFTLPPDWTALAGSWGTLGSSAVLWAHSAPAVRETARRVTTSADGVVSFTLGAAAVNGQGVAFRIQDAQNMLLVNFVTGTGNMTISKYVAGVSSTLLAFPVSFAAGSSFTVTLEGPAITVRNAATGAVLGTVSDATFQTATGYGITASSAMATDQAARWGEIGWTYTHAVPAHDVLVDATPSSNDLNVRNVIRASRTGGTLQTRTEQASVDAYGAYEYQRTDLGVVNDTHAANWAQAVLDASAWPRIVIEDVTMLPAIDAQSWLFWPVVLGVLFVTDAVRVVWAPPDIPDAPEIDQTTRVVGVSHRITRAEWSVQWQLAALSMSPVGTQTMAADAAELVEA